MNSMLLSAVVVLGAMVQAPPAPVVVVVETSLGAITIEVNVA